MTYREPFLTQLVQQSLHAQGLYDGAFDGIAGPKTAAGFERYVDANRIVTAGKYTRFTDELTTAQGYDLGLFLAGWRRNHPRYHEVAGQVNVPAPLIAAIHWRESGGDFGTYLHNGNPLGQLMTDIPRLRAIFNHWETAAVDALDTNGKDATARDALGITASTQDLDVLCEFAERYNGLGYRRRGVPSPYVLSGTTGYTAGKFTSDGVYDPARVDRQLGVLPMLRAIGSTLA